MRVVGVDIAFFFAPHLLNSLTGNTSVFTLLYLLSSKGLVLKLVFQNSWHLEGRK